MTGPDLATWATVVGTWAPVIGTLAFTYWQMRRTHRLNSASTILDLRERYDAPGMRAARRSLAAQLVSGDSGAEIENFEVGHFFELMGFLIHHRVLDRRTVWNAFGGGIRSNFLLLSRPVDRIAAWRKESGDPLIWGQFQWLSREMQRLDRLYLPGPGSGTTTIEDARGILESEAGLKATS